MKNLNRILRNIFGFSAILISALILTTRKASTTVSSFTGGGGTSSVYTSGSTQTKTGGLNIMGNVGVGITTPTEKVHVVGNVKATRFLGDGSQLTGIQTNVQVNGNASTFTVSQLWVDSATVFGTLSSTTPALLNGSSITNTLDVSTGGPIYRTRSIVFKGTSISSFNVMASSIEITLQGSSTTASTGQSTFSIRELRAGGDLTVATSPFIARANAFHYNNTGTTMSITSGFGFTMNGSTVMPTTMSVYKSSDTSVYALVTTTTFRVPASAVVGKTSYQSRVDFNPPLEVPPNWSLALHIDEVCSSCTLPMNGGVLLKYFLNP